MTHEGKLRRVGGSVMLTIPPAMLDALGLEADAAVDITVETGRLIVAGRARPRYSLDELLARCKPSAPRPKDREWVSAKRAGRELL